jgi:hypothetical protein
MPTYKIETTVKLRGVGEFEANTKEEAIEMYRQEYLKVDYSKNLLGWLSSGWNPKVKELKDK